MNDSLILRHGRLGWSWAQATADGCAGGVLAVAAIDVRAGLAELLLVDLQGSRAGTGAAGDLDEVTRKAHRELMAAHHVALQHVRVALVDAAAGAGEVVPCAGGAPPRAQEAMLAMAGLTRTPVEPLVAMRGLSAKAVDGPAEAHRRVCTVIASYRDRFGRGDPPGMTRDGWRSWVDARQRAESAATVAIFEVARATGALLLPLKWGNGFVSMHPDNRRQGAWRTTTFTDAMEPSGHMEWNTPLEAAHLMLHNGQANEVHRLAC